MTDDRDFLIERAHKRADIKRHNGIPLVSGVNDCAWNDLKRCNVERCGPECTYTQLGIWICSAYKPFGLMYRPVVGGQKCGGKHARVFACRGTRRCLDCGKVFTSPKEKP